MPRRRRQLSTALALVSAVVCAACTGAGSDDAAGTEEAPVDIHFARTAAEALPSRAAGGTLAGVTPPGADGTWLIAGNRVDAENRAAPSVWRSTDGVTWDEQELPAGKGRPEVQDVAERNGVHVLLGTRRRGSDQRVTAWLSDDDGSFTEVGRDAFGASPRTWATSVTSGPDGFVAVGRVNPATSDDGVVLWTSPDGRTWNRMDELPTLDGTAASASVGGIAHIDGNMVIGGSVRGDGGRDDAAVWYEDADGRWQLVDDAPSFVGPGEDTINEVAVMGDHLVAVGSVGGDAGSVPAVWRSRDGRSWERVDARMEILDRGTSTMGSSFRLVRAVGDVLVAVVDGPYVPRLVRSVDQGVTWTEEPVPEELVSAYELGLDDLAAAGPDDLVTVSTEGAPVVLRVQPGQQPLEVTADGRTFPAPLPSGRIDGIEQVDGQLAARGTRSTAEREAGTSSARALLLTSSDGETWEPKGNAAHWKGTTVRSVVAFQGELLALGYGKEESAEGGESSRPLAWEQDDDRWRTVPTSRTVDGQVVEDDDFHVDDVIAVGDRLVAVVGGFVDGEVRTRVVTSGDGKTWETLDPAAGLVGEGNHFVQNLCAVEGGIIAIGIDQTGDRQRPIAWVSADGTSWTPTEIPARAGSATAWRCAATAAGAVTVGYQPSHDGNDAAVWTTTDGTSWEEVTSDAFGPYAFLSGVAADGNTVVAVGTEHAEVMWDPAVWLSEDAGATWRQLELALDEVRGASTQFHAVHVEDDRITLAGSADDEPAIWTGTLAATASS